MFCRQPNKGSGCFWYFLKIHEKSWCSSGQNNNAVIVTLRRLYIVACFQFVFFKGNEVLVSRTGSAESESSFIAQHNVSLCLVHVCCLLKQSKNSFRNCVVLVQKSSTTRLVVRKVPEVEMQLQTDGILLRRCLLSRSGGQEVTASTSTSHHPHIITIYALMSVRFRNTSSLHAF